MESENPVASVLPMPEPLLEQSAGRLDKVAGDIIGAFPSKAARILTEGYKDYNGKGTSSCRNQQAMLYRVRLAGNTSWGTSSLRNRAARPASGRTRPTI